MALENLEFKDQIGLIWRRTNRMGRRRRRREEEEEKRKMEEPRSSQQGMETNLDHGIEWIYGI